MQARRLSKWLTEQLVWRLYESLPPVVDDVLKWRFPYILPFKNLRIPIVTLYGQTLIDGKMGTVIVAGDEHRVDYLCGRFFKDKPRREPLGKLPLWKVARTLKQLRASADLTIAYADRLSARLFFGREHLAVPVWVGAMLTIPEDIAELTRGNPSLKTDLRNVRRNNLSHEVTHSESDFETFYHTMYVPYIRNRHGEQARIQNFYKLRRCFHQGGLIWLMQDGEPIAGAVFQQRNDVLRFLLLGTANGDLARVKTGALAALYFFIFKHAQELRCKLIDLRGSRPSLNDGVLRYKLKWGAKLTERPDTRHYFLVQWNSFNSSVISFLSSTPLIFRDHDGLSAIYVIYSEKPVTSTEAWKVYHSKWIPGLQQLYLFATSGWEPGVSNPPHTHLLEATTVEHRDAGRLMK